MAQAQFRFYEELNDFLAPEQRKRDIELSFDPPVPVGHLIETLGVPHTEVELILVNGLSVGLEYMLGEADRVSVYPVFETIDVSTKLRLRSQSLRESRFLADAHLGRLARYLRMLGFDTLFFNDRGDAHLVEISVQQHRILLTRDKALLMHKKVTHGVYIRSTDPRLQLIQVLNRMDLMHAIRPFIRCMECNALVESVTSASVEGSLPKRVVQHYNEFWRCTGCGRIYWKGHHYQAMQRWIADLQNQQT